jgi:hypothetical protein
VEYQPCGLPRLPQQKRKPLAASSRPVQYELAIA